MSSLPTYAIVPVKGLALAKRRLAPVLPDAARRRLVLAMLEDVLAAIAGVREIERVVVVTPDADAGSLAAGRGATILPEPGAGELNAAVESGVAFALSRGIGRVLVLPADIPLARPEELASLIGSRRSAPGVTLAPVARRQWHQRHAARPARRDRAVLWAGQLSAAYVAGHGAAHRRQRAAPGRRRPRHRRAGGSGGIVGGGPGALWLSRALPRRR